MPTHPEELELQDFYQLNCLFFTVVTVELPSGSFIGSYDWRVCHEHGTSSHLGFLVLGSWFLVQWLGTQVILSPFGMLWFIFKVLSFSGSEGTVSHQGPVSWFFFMVLFMVLFHGSFHGSVSFLPSSVHKVIVYGCLVQTFLGFPCVVTSIKSLPFDEVFDSEYFVLGFSHSHPFVV